MRARPSMRSLPLLAAALVAAVVSAAGGSGLAPARASEHPCDDQNLDVVTGLSRGEAAGPCAESGPPPPPPTPTVTDPDPGPEPPLDPGATPTPTPEPVITTETREPPPAEPPAPSSAPRAPAPTTPAAPPVTGGDSFGGTSGTAGPPHSQAPRLSGGPYVFPVVGPSSFTDTWGAARSTVSWHHGVDIFAPSGAPIVAVADGSLFSVGWNRIGGQRLWLRDGEGNYFYYAHLSGFSRVAVEGARVRAGTVVGYVGNTGDAAGTPPHLHFEIHPVSLLALGYDGAVNPFLYVSSWPRLDEGRSLGGAAGASRAAPAPGAFLLGFTDISGAGSRPAQPLARTLGQERREASTSAGAAEPANREAARIVGSLEAEALDPAPHGAEVWDSLAACESGGNWAADTGNGYSGGLQFHPQTWVSHGGSAFASAAHLATREQQITIAERVLVTQGWRAWPACSAMLGLRTLGDT